MTSERMFDRLQAVFDETLAGFLASPAMQDMKNGVMTKAEFASVMREVFHYSKESPQLHAMACMGFHGRERRLVKMFFNHATAEIGHDQLALNDVVAMGVDATSIPYENPLPATTAMVAFAFYQIHRLNPVGFVGYVYFLEFLPTQAGPAAIEWLRAIGVDDSMTSFLRDHAEIDLQHNKLMAHYVDGLIKDEASFHAAAHAIRTTGALYGDMMRQAVAHARKPAERGWDYQELAADGLTPEAISRKRPALKLA